MAGKTTKKKPARSRAKAPSTRSRAKAPPAPVLEHPVIDELPGIHPLSEDLESPLDLHQLDDLLARHTFQLERYTRDLPELQRLESETRAARERIKHRINQRLRDPATAEHKAFTSRFAKQTEALYSAEVELDAEWLTANEVLREIRKRIAEVNRIQTLFEHRRTVIRGLIELYAAEYWGISDRERSRVGRPDNDAPTRGETGRRAFKRREQRA